MHDIRLEMEKLERLTFKGNFCDIAQCRELSCPYGGSCSHKKVWERLKAYEETGLSPIACAQAAEAERLLSDTGVQLERIIEIVKADKDGRVVVFPCKLGDTLYYAPEWYLRCGYGCEPVSVEAVNSYNGNVVVECYLDPDTNVSAVSGDFGKKVFLTREEAEQALRAEREEMKDGDK